MSDQPAADQPVIDQPVTDQPVTDQPVSAQQPVTDPAVADAPVDQAVPDPAVGGTPVPPPAFPPSFPGGAIHSADVWAVPAHLVPKPRRKRPWVRTALRWTTAVVVCLAVGTGTAFAVLAPRRTDIPGLATPADSRYTFPQLTLPPLPPKALTPGQGKVATGTPDHAADLRKLVLPAPLGAKADHSVTPGPGGWYPTASYLSDMGGSTQLTPIFDDYALRHIAVRAWTGPDGVRTPIYLLGFPSDDGASTVYLQDVQGTRPAGGKGTLDPDPAMTFPGLLESTQSSTLSQSAAPGRSAMRLGFLNVGDVEAVVVMSSPKAVPLVNFRQVMTLQGELLQG